MVLKSTQYFKGVVKSLSTTGKLASVKRRFTDRKSASQARAANYILKSCLVINPARTSTWGSSRRTRFCSSRGWTVCICSKRCDGTWCTIAAGGGSLWWSHGSSVPALLPRVATCSGGGGGGSRGANSTGTGQSGSADSGIVLSCCGATRASFRDVVSHTKRVFGAP